MKIFSIIIFVLIVIPGCCQIAFAQMTPVEGRQRSPAFNAADYESEVADTDDEFKIPDIGNDFYQAGYKNDWQNNRIQTKDTNAQIKFLEQITFNRRHENFRRKENADLGTFDSKTLKSDKFDFQPCGNLSKNITRTVHFERSEFSAAEANPNKFAGQFYKQLPVRSLDPGQTWARINDAPDDVKPTKKKEKFHWKPAFLQSMLFLGIQHGMRIWRQEKTSSELGGPFFQDWFDSVKNLRGWDDGNKIFTNYVAHPMQGAFTGRIFINNSDRAKKQEFGKSKVYWESRLKAMAWTAVWSTQFEIGPLSEASIGNVGIYDKTGPSKLAWGDQVITPIVGTAWVVGEDAIDKYVLKNWLERKAGYKTTTKIKILRTFLTPMTSMGNLIRLKVPWKRDNRSTYQIQTPGQ